MSQLGWVEACIRAARVRQPAVREGLLEVGACSMDLTQKRGVRDGERLGSEVEPSCLEGGGA